MAELKKFLFDNFVIGGSDTKIPAPLPDIVDENQHPVPIEEVLVMPEADPQEVEPIIETYTKEDLSKSVAEAEKSGYEKGYEAARQELDNQNNALLTDISQKLTVLLAGSVDDENKREQETAELIKQALQTLIPSLLDEKAAELVDHFLKDNFNNFKHNEKLSFYIHPDIISYIQEIIVKLANSYDFEGKIAIHKDSSLDKSSCRVEWDNGGVEYAPRKQLEQIEEMLDKQ
ncbi:MAG: hypothetical protein IJ660_07870 [Alphaproteobacteria bacterium]|nr:hypothetical protein [Alphaproteobacteria bacterium]